MANFLVKFSHFLLKRRRQNESARSIYIFLYLSAVSQMNWCEPTCLRSVRTEAISPPYIIDTVLLTGWSVYITPKSQMKDDGSVIRCIAVCRWELEPLSVWYLTKSSACFCPFLPASFVFPLACLSAETSLHSLGTSALFLPDRARCSAHTCTPDACNTHSSLLKRSLRLFARRTHCDLQQNDIYMCIYRENQQRQQQQKKSSFLRRQ